MKPNIQNWFHVMPALSDFPITKRWPAQNPEILQLYSFPTPNGRKIAIALEEMGLEYEPHRVRISDEDVRSPEFLSLNPNNKIPAIIDPNGPDGDPIGIFESGAILLYLADKTGKLIPNDMRGRMEVTKWLMWQMAGQGPMFGQLGFFFKFKGTEIEDPRPGQRYLDEGKRILSVLDKALEERDWIAGDYSIADIAIAPWLIALENYGVKDRLGFDSYSRVTAFQERFLDRPAVQRGLNVPPRNPE